MSRKDKLLPLSGQLLRVYVRRSRVVARGFPTLNELANKAVTPVWICVSAYVVVFPVRVRLVYSGPGYRCF